MSADCQLERVRRTYELFQRFPKLNFNLNFEDFKLFFQVAFEAPFTNPKRHGHFALNFQ